MEIGIEARDLQQVDLDRLGWTGGENHLRVLGIALQRSWLGEMDVVVLEVTNGAIVGCGAVDHTHEPSLLMMLSVHPDWQSLGLGSWLVAELEQRVRQQGRQRAAIRVELDNPRAKELYLRLGYEYVGDTLDGWRTGPTTHFVTVSRHLEKQLDA